MAAFECAVAMRDISPADDWFQARRETLARGALRAGYRTSSFTQGVAEPIWTRTLVTRHADTLMVLITADLGRVSPYLLTRVRQILGNAPGFEQAQIALAASHTHSGPPYEDGDAYCEWVAREMAESAKEAAADLAPSRIGATHGFCNALSYYERIPVTRENAARIGADPRHIGGIKHSRDYVEARAAAGPIDPQVGVVRIDRADGMPKAVLVHFTAHPAVEIEPPHVSPDYVGFAMNAIRREMPAVVPLFCQGADGAVNINNIFGTLAHARQHGEALAREVLRVVHTIETTDCVDAACACSTFNLEYSPVPTQKEIDEELAACRSYINALERNPDEVWVGHGKHAINLPPAYPPEARRRMVEVRISQLERVRSMPGRVFPPAPVELQLFRWNDIALIFSSFELFVQLGLEVKRRSPHRYTFPVCYSGGGPCGYLAPAEEIARGGYHFVHFNPARRAPGNADRLVDNMVALTLREQTKPTESEPGVPDKRTDSSSSSAGG